MAGTRSSSENRDRRATQLRRVVPTEPDYARCLPVVRAVVRLVGRRYRLSATEVEDLHSDTWLKLLADSGRALRRFRGRSRLHTYLTRIATNTLLDKRNREWGKWRPAAAAVRGGAIGVALDRLVSRDGLPFDQAIDMLRVTGVPVDGERLETLACQLPRRAPRRQMVSDSDLHQRPAPSPSPYELMRRQETEMTAAHAASTLAEALGRLAARDRDLLAWRYADGRSIAVIARALSVDQKPLYRHFERLLARLRVYLAGQGIGRNVIEDILVSMPAVSLQATSHLPGRLRRTA